MKSKEIDRYIENAAPFAQPILRRLREIVHKAEPRVEETIKWSAPFFDYKGVVCGMAAFKAGVGLHFWKQPLLSDPQGFLDRKYADVKELPPEKVLAGFVRESVRLNEEGVKVGKAPRAASPAPIVVPDDLGAALEKNVRARAVFEKFPPSHKREYIEWINDAKQDATRKKRLEQAVEWMAEGKPRNWKYMKK